MDYEVSVATSRKYILCKVRVPITRELAIEFSIEMDALSHEHDIGRFLTDARGAPNVSNNLENRNFAYEDMKEMDLQRNVRAAILADPQNRSHDFVETVTRNAGYRVRVFHDEKAAISWLEE